MLGIRFNRKPRRPLAPVTSLSQALVVGGALCLAAFGILYQLEADTRQWPTADGTVLTSRVIGAGSEPALDFLYSFRVDGKIYRGRNVTAADHYAISPFRSTDPADVVARYPQGSSVTVFYRPSDLRQSVLEPGSSAVNILGLLLGTVMLASGVVAYFRRPFREIDAQEAFDRYNY